MLKQCCTVQNILKISFQQWYTSDASPVPTAAPAKVLLIDIHAFFFVDQEMYHPIFTSLFIRLSFKLFCYIKKSILRSKHNSST